MDGLKKKSLKNRYSSQKESEITILKQKKQTLRQKSRKRMTTYKAIKSLINQENLAILNLKACNIISTCKKPKQKHREKSAKSPS